MLEESLATYPKPGDTNRMALTEDQIRKGQRGSQEELTHQQEKTKKFVLLTCFLAYLFVGEEVVWTGPKSPGVIGEAGSYGL